MPRYLLERSQEVDTGPPTVLDMNRAAAESLLALRTQHTTTDYYPVDTA